MLTLYIASIKVILLIQWILRKELYVIITDFNAFKTMREKRGNSLYAEINTHDTYGYMSTSIWNYPEVCEMISHSSRKAVSQVQDIIDRIVAGEEIYIKEDEITSLFRIATDTDIANAKKDEISFRKELDEFANSPHDTSIEDMLLKRLGLDDEK